MIWMLGFWVYFLVVCVLAVFYSVVLVVGFGWLVAWWLGLDGVCLVLCVLVVYCLLFIIVYKC